MFLETTERRSCNILPKEKVTNFPGRYFRWVQIYIHPYSCKSTTPFARLKLWHLLPNLVKSEAPLVGIPFLSTTFPHSFHRPPPKKMVKKKAHSFQTKKNSNLRLEGRIASDLSRFFSLYYLSTRNFAEISTEHHTWPGRNWSES